MTTRHSLTLRLAATLALFALLYWQIDIARLRSEFTTIAPGWALAALTLTVPQVLISAWRWRLTARQIGLRLAFPTAVREYYLATFLNQVLPGGVVGDANRAWRHGRQRDNSTNALHAVLIERLSGQLALALVTLVAIAVAPTLRAGLADVLARLPAPAAGAGLLAAVLCAGLVIYTARRHPGSAAAIRRFFAHVNRALLGRRIWLAQLLGSLLVTLTYIGVFVCAALTIGGATPVAEIWVLVPPVLLAMVIPLSIAGWGIRESAAALIWTLAGLPAHEGVALSLTYGALVLLSSLPGALVPCFTLSCSFRSRSNSMSAPIA